MDRKISTRRHQEGLLLNRHNGILAKGRPKIEKVGDEEFDQIPRMGIT